MLSLALIECVTTLFSARNVALTIRSLCSFINLRIFLRTYQRTAVTPRVARTVRQLNQCAGRSHAGMSCCLSESTVSLFDPFAPYVLSDLDNPNVESTE